MKKSYKRGLLILGVVLAIVISSNIILNNLISKVVASEIEKINSKGEINFYVNKVKIDVFTSSLTLKGIEIKPDSLFFESFKLGKTKKAVASEFFLSELKIKGINIVNILLFNEISARKIRIAGIDLILYKSNIFIEKDEKPIVKGASKKNAFDSIFIKGVDQIDLSKIEIDDFNFRIVNVQEEDIIFEYNGKECEISGIALKPYENTENYFKFNKDSLRINLKNQLFNFEEGNYQLTFEDILYDYPLKEVKILNFNMNPSIDKAELASTYRYNKEVFEVETKEIVFNGFYLDSIVRLGAVNMDSIVVDGLKLAIYKDQTKPFNLNKRPLFLNQKLKKLKDPIYINKVVIKNSLFEYREKHVKFKELMAIDISEMNAELNYITSIKDSLKTDKELTIYLKGKLNSVADLNLEIFMPYNTWNNSFSFTGSVGNSKFSDFNSAVYPAAGLKFEGGNLNSMQFNVQGTPKGTHGRMSMFYSDIEADVIVDNKKKKAVSWLANSVLVTSNPSEKGKVRLALIETERVLYKGFGNLLWKSVMSGMMNTLNPLGKTFKEDNQKHQKDKRKKLFSKS